MNKTELTNDQREALEEWNRRQIARGGCGLPVAAVIIAALVLALTGCKATRTVTVERVRTDTIYQTRTEHDSIYVSDSIHESERQLGDTVLLTRERWRTKYVERLRRDTVISHVTDTVPVPVEVTREVARPLTWWQRTRIAVGNMVLAAAAIGVIIYMRRLWKRMS